MQKQLMFEFSLPRIHGRARVARGKVIRPSGHFPSDEAALKVLYLAIRNREKRWTHPRHGWGAALQHFSIYFEGRIPTN